MADLKDIIHLSNITGERVAVGVSGGADSLALVLLLDELLQVRGQRVVALTVDHGLRQESRQEAEYVASLMAERGIEHHILTWKGDKPHTGVEEMARLVRYRLLREWCEANSVETLCVAHHLQDQAETFLIRLQRGSGLTGLCGMAEVSFLENLKLVRPLLHISPEALKAYLREKGIHWVEDPSNQSDDFLRCRIRKFLPTFEEVVGISAQRLVDTMQVLARSKDYIQQQVEKFEQANVTFYEQCGACVSLKELSHQHEEIIYQVLRQLIKNIGGKHYVARAEDVERLASRIFDDKMFRGATLGQCEIFVSRGKLWFIQELKEKRQLPKKVWSDFIKLFPEYQKMRLPYKLRVVLVKNKMPIEF